MFSDPGEFLFSRLVLHVLDDPLRPFLFKEKITNHYIFWEWNTILFCQKLKWERATQNCSQIGSHLKCSSTPYLFWEWNIMLLSWILTNEDTMVKLLANWEPSKVWFCSCSFWELKTILFCG
jgi:hypothetical protein